MPYALLEEEVSVYLINETQNHFSGTKVVNFNNGVPDKEKQMQIKNDILGKLTGSIGDKVIVAFNSNQEAATTVEDISLNNAPEHYAYLSEECVKKLMVGHRITSPLLLGIRESGGGLGSNADEIQVSTDLFLNIVIKPSQDIVIDALNDLLAVNDIALNLYFKTLKPLDFMDEETDLTDDQIEEETGIKQEDIEEQKVEVDLKTIDGNLAYKTVAEAEAQAKKLGCKGHHEHNENGTIWFMPCKSHDKMPKSMYMSEDELSEDLSKEILGSLAETGEKISEDYEYVDELDEDSKYSNEDWANYLINEKETTLSKIKGLLGLNQDYINNNPKESSLLDSKNGLYKIRYKYAKGMPNKGESRDFCTEMMKLSRFGIVWRLEDIERASVGKKEEVNVDFRHKPNIKYDIFTLKGGIYCKHIWKRVLYRLKSNTQKSNNLDNYKVTKTIPKSYLKNPIGSKKAGIPTFKQAGQGKYPK